MENASDIQPTRNMRLALVAEVRLPKLTSAIAVESGLRASMLNLPMVLDTAKSAIVLNT
jgi:hypothetical protein